MSAPAQRPTTTKTFRIHRDQLAYINKHNKDCPSLFLRFLLDTWMRSKIPFEVRKEYFELRRAYREQIEFENKKKG